MDLVDNVELLDFVVSTNPLSDVIDEVVNEIFLWILFASTIVVGIAVPEERGKQVLTPANIEYTVNSFIERS